MAVDVVGNQNSAGAQVGPYCLKFPGHIGVGVQAIVYEEIDTAQSSE